MITELQGRDVETGEKRKIGAYRQRPISQPSSLSLDPKSVSIRNSRGVLHPPCQDGVADPSATNAALHRQLFLLEHRENISSGSPSIAETPIDNLTNEARPQNRPSPLLPRHALHGRRLQPRHLQPAVVQPLGLPHALQVPPALGPAAASEPDAAAPHILRPSPFFFLLPLPLLLYLYLCLLRTTTTATAATAGAQGAAPKVQRDAGAGGRDAAAAGGGPGGVERAPAGGAVRVRPLLRHDVLPRRP